MDADSARYPLLVSEDRGSRPSFSDAFDDEFAVGPDEGNRAYFGRDVLRGLVDGIEDFIHARQPRWSQHPRWAGGSVLLGSAMWIDDPELINKLQELTGASIVIRKQSRTRKKRQDLERLSEINEQTSGLPIRAFADLTGLAPKVDGKPVVVGPYDRMDEGVVPMIRTIGYRRKSEYVPIIHAKLALLGHLKWYDEHPAGGVGEWVSFSPRRLWVSSANFTRSSRESLEFGYWTEEPALVQGAERFLLKLIRSSEAVDPDADDLEPELAPVDFDDEAMAEAAAEMNWADDEDE